jgi:hypothetical protein
MSFITANDLILGAMKFANIYAPGESLDDADAQDALTTMNDLLDSWSTTQAAVFKTNENIFTFTAGKYEYSIGNYDAGEFAGTTTLGLDVISNVDVPSDMVVGGDLSGVGIPEGATIVAFNSFTNTVTMSQNATVGFGPQQIAYTIPGDFKMERPLRLKQKGSFTRITTQASGLDYPITSIDEAQYNQIGYKGIAGPWPIVMWYNATYPLGTLKFYQNPSQAGELHLFTENILQIFADLTEEVMMPQGYSRAIKRNLARELAPEYGAIWTPMMEKLAKESFDAIKALNMTPVPVADYDVQLLRPNATDAGWILHGGFR